MSGEGGGGGGEAAEEAGGRARGPGPHAKSEAQMVEGGIRARVGRAVACGWARAVGRREVEGRARTGPLVKRGVAHADAALETGRAHGCVGRLALWIIDRVRLLVARLEDTDLLAPPSPLPSPADKVRPPQSVVHQLRHHARRESCRRLRRHGHHGFFSPRARADQADLRFGCARLQDESGAPGVRPRRRRPRLRPKRRRDRHRNAGDDARPEGLGCPPSGVRVSQHVKGGWATSLLTDAFLPRILTSFSLCGCSRTAIRRRDPTGSVGFSHTSHKNQAGRAL